MSVSFDDRALSMAVPTVVVGVLPHHGEVSLLVAVLLVGRPVALLPLLCRLLQLFSFLQGEDILLHYERTCMRTQLRSDSTKEIIRLAGGESVNL